MVISPLDGVENMVGIGESDGCHEIPKEDQIYLFSVVKLPGTKYMFIMQCDARVLIFKFLTHYQTTKF